MHLRHCSRMFSHFLKAKNFHWQMSGRHFRDYHLMMDEQADQMIAMTDAIAERVRKIGRRTIGSIGEVVRRRRLKDCDVGEVSSRPMLTELHSDNLLRLGFMREIHVLSCIFRKCLGKLIDETEGRTWFCMKPPATETMSSGSMTKVIGS